MTNSSRHDEPRNGETGDRAPEIDVLIGRLIDGEAQGDDIDRFAEAVARDRGVAARLADRQRDHALVSAAVAAEIDRACCVELPAHAATMQRTPVVAILRHTPAYLGWAAAIVLALILGLGDFSAPPREIDVVDLEKIRPHIIEQRTVPGALDPVLWHSNQLPDGRWEIGVMERPLRIYILDHFDKDFLRRQRADQIALPERDDS